MFCPAYTADPNLHLLELWDEVGYRLDQEEVPLLIKHHHCDARDGLCHRADPEDVVSLHRLSSIPVGHTKRLDIGNLAVTRHETDSTRNAILVDALLDVPAYSLEPFGG